MGYWNDKLPHDQRKQLSKFFGREVNYLCPEHIEEYSKRYKKTITVVHGYPSDGATWAVDIDSRCWFVHDRACDTGRWDDGTKMTNWQCSRIISDILHDDFKQLVKRGNYWTAVKRKARAYTWFWATFFGGGGEARKNGMLWLKSS